MRQISVWARPEAGREGAIHRAALVTTVHDAAVTVEKDNFLCTRLRILVRQLRDLPLLTVGLCLDLGVLASLCGKSGISPSNPYKTTSQSHPL